MCLQRPERKRLLLSRHGCKPWRFQIYPEMAVQMFYEDGNAFGLFVWSRGYTQCVLVRNNECKYNFVCLYIYKKTLILNL